MSVEFIELTPAHSGDNRVIFNVRHITRIESHSDTTTSIYLSTASSYGPTHIRVQESFDEVKSAINLCATVWEGRVFRSEIVMEEPPPEDERVHLSPEDEPIRLPFLGVSNDD